MSGESSRQRGGFTLIELLTVIAIIAVLLGIILPTVASVRESAWSTRCKTHLRNIGVELQAYVARDTRCFPPFDTATWQAWSERGGVKADWLFCPNRHQGKEHTMVEKAWGGAEPTTDYEVFAGTTYRTLDSRHDSSVLAKDKDGNHTERLGNQSKTIGHNVLYGNYAVEWVPSN